VQTLTQSAPRRNSSGLIRDIEILEILAGEEAASAGGLGVARVAQIAGRDKAVVSRSLATLAEACLVERDQSTLAYRLGSRLFSLAALTTESRLSRQAGPFLRRIAQRSRESAHLCVLCGGSVLAIATELGLPGSCTVGRADVFYAAWQTVSGRALLSDWDDTSVAHWFQLHSSNEPIDPVPAGGTGVFDLASLLSELKRLRQNGFARSYSDLDTGVIGLSAPVRDFTGRVVAALTASAPASSVDERLSNLACFVASSAHGLSAKMGYVMR
jgi:DNA-binding IclR family transcriptional regulator